MIAFYANTFSQAVLINQHPGTSGHMVIGQSNYHVSESIYTDVEIGHDNFTTVSSSIKRIAFLIERGFSNPIVNNFHVYLKNIPGTTTIFSSGAYNTSGYTEVFNGSINTQPVGFASYNGSINAQPVGYVFIDLSVPFVRTPGSNLQILIERLDNTVRTDAYTIHANCSVGNYLSTTALSCRRYNNTTLPISGTTILAQSNFRPSIGLNYLGSDLFLQPKIYISKAVLNVGETTTITGQDFTANGIIKLVIENKFGELIPLNNSFTYLPDGSFSYQFSPNSLTLDGEYKVHAIDLNTSKTTTPITFIVSKPVIHNLWINNPSLNDNYQISDLFQIQWGDFIDRSSPIGNSGFVQKRYKIELTNNDGASWTNVENEHIISNGIAGVNNNNFSSTLSVAAPGIYRVRITDIDNPSNSNTSSTFNIITTPNNGFSYSLEWDKSSPEPMGMPHPIGLAADGTSRIFVKLSRLAGNTKAVSTIAASISAIANNYTEIDLLGKIMPSTNNITYNEEANNANSTSVIATLNSTNNDFWFWLVAPDDFTHELADQRSERKIKIDFLITYSDNSSDLITTNQNAIEIVRPPLFLVHGINSSEKAFEKARYDVGAGVQLFDGDGKGGTIKNPVWKEAQRLNLYNYESFARNAEILLGINIQGDKYYNTIQAFLNGMHKKGYACNRIDYVGHSMGGCVARTMINLYAVSYNPGINSTRQYKNYNKGYINKLITLNTPHNGALIADFVNDVYPGMINVNNALFMSNLRFYTNSFNGFFISNGLGIKNYIVSPALKNLQAFHGGIRFTETIVKNHLIGSDLDEFNNTPEGILRFKSDPVYDALYTHLLPFFQNNIKDFMFEHYQEDSYLNNSDYLVPVRSQLAGRESIATNLDSDPLGESSSSIVYGDTRIHSDITEDLVVGTKIMHLLNAPINSTYFADNIQANTSPNGTDTYKQVSNSLVADSIKYYFDTTHIKVNYPDYNSILFVGSTINFDIAIIDTTGLKQTRLIFQSQVYESDTTWSQHFFNIKVSPDEIGKSSIIAEAIYDSSGFSIHHIDTITIEIKAADQLNGFNVQPKANILNPHQLFQPRYNTIYNSYLGILNNNIDSLTFHIADTNVVIFDSINYQFITKDTGTTYITFSYKGFTDTAYIYLTDASITNTPCDPPAAPVSISGLTTICTNSTVNVNYTIIPVPGAITYRWNLPANTLLISSSADSTSIQVRYLNTFVSGSITIQTVSACGISAITSLAVIKRVTAIPISITGPTNACPYTASTGIYANNNATYTADSISGITYLWTLPSNASLISGQNTNSIHVHFTGSFVSGYISLKTVDTCLGVDSIRKLLITKAKPAIPDSIYGPVDICSYIGTGAQLIFSVNPVLSAISYKWSLPATVNLISATSDSTSITVTLNSSFNAIASSIIKVRSLSACGNSSDKALTIVNNKPGPAKAITGPVNACTYIGTPTTATYTTTQIRNATSYNWIVPVGVLVVSHPNGLGPIDTIITVTFNNNFNSPSNISVQGVSACGLGTITSLSISSGNVSAPGTIVGPTDPCPTIGSLAGAVYSVASSTNATSYNWIVPVIGATIRSGQGTNSIIVDFTAAFTTGSIKVQATNSCSVSAFKILTLTRRLPAAPGTVSEVLITDACPLRQYSYTVAIPVHVTSFLWTAPNGGTIVSGQGTSSVVIEYGPEAIDDTIRVIGINNCASSSVRKKRVRLQACPPVMTFNFSKNNSTTQVVTPINKPSKENPLTIEANVFPNPSENNFYILLTTKDKEKIIVRIVDPAGRELRILNIKADKIFSFGNDLKPGVYIIEIRQGENVITKKIIKL